MQENTRELQKDDYGQWKSRSTVQLLLVSKNMWWKDYIYSLPGKICLLVIMNDDICCWEINCGSQISSTTLILLSCSWNLLVHFCFLGNDRSWYLQMLGQIQGIYSATTLGMMPMLPESPMCIKKARTINSCVCLSSNLYFIIGNCTLGSIEVGYYGYQ